MSSADRFYTVIHDWMELMMHRSMRGYIHYAREKGLSRSMIGTLFHLSHQDHAGVSDLGEHLGVSSAAASQMLERLVEEGLIQRTEDPEDRRMKKITLTETGYRVMKESVSARTRWLKELIERFSDQEKKQIEAAMLLMIEKTRELNIDQDCAGKLKGS